MVCRRARPCAPWFARCVPPSISGSAFVIGETCVRRKLLRGPPALSKVQTRSLHRASGVPAFMDHPDLTITRVHATPLNLPVTMGGRSTSLSICLVDVETSAGITGTDIARALWPASGRVKAVGCEVTWSERELLPVAPASVEA